MGLEEFKTVTGGLTTEEWNSALGWLFSVEKPRRDAAPIVAAAQADLVRQVRDVSPAEAVTTAPVAGWPVGLPIWDAPGDDPLKAYLVGDTVAYNGRVYRSVLEGLNLETPGAGACWLDVTDTPPVDDEPAGEDPRVAADGSVATDHVPATGGAATDRIPATGGAATDRIPATG